MTVSWWRDLDARPETLFPCAIPTDVNPGMSYKQRTHIMLPVTNAVLTMRLVFRVALIALRIRRITLLTLLISFHVQNSLWHFLTRYLQQRRLECGIRLGCACIAPRYTYCIEALYRSTLCIQCCMYGAPQEQTISSLYRQPSLYLQYITMCTVSSRHL